MIKKYYSNELYHWRTKGSKNGVRLYQNEDGTYTELGKARRRAEYQKMSDDELQQQVWRKGQERALEKLEFQNNQKDPNEEAIKDLRTVSNDINSLSERVRQRRNNTISYEPIDLSKMSDSDLRKAIDRRRLEDQYTQLYGKRYESRAEKGKRYAQNALQATSDVLMVGATALSIAYYISRLRG